MRAVDMHVNALDVLGVDVAGDMRALVNDQHRLPARRGFMGEDRAVKPCADDKIIIHFKYPPFHIRLNI